GVTEISWPTGKLITLLVHERLQKQGLVHKLDGLGAFVICKHGAPHAVEVFHICKNCESVDELKELNPTLHELVHDASGSTRFDADMVRVEIRGTCEKCNH
ncbi:MAG: hypothetical protein AAF225_14115, partial [Pseudomonadota bacterium]